MPTGRSQRHLAEVQGLTSYGDVTPPAAGQATNITLSASTVAGSSALGTTVGTLSASGGEVGNTYTYSLVSNPGGLFSILVDALKTAVAPTISAGSKPITVRAKDQHGRIFDKAFTITVT